MTEDLAEGSPDGQSAGAYTHEGGQLLDEVRLRHVAAAGEPEDVPVQRRITAGGGALADAGRSGNPHHAALLLGDPQIQGHVLVGPGGVDLPAVISGQLGLQAEPHLFADDVPLLLEDVGDGCRTDVLQGRRRHVERRIALDVLGKAFARLLFLFFAVHNAVFYVCWFVPYSLSSAARGS